MCVYIWSGWLVGSGTIYGIYCLSPIRTACEKSLAMWAPGTLYLDYQRKQNILCFQSERGCDFSCSATFERHDLVLRKKRFPYYLPFVSRMDSRTKGKQCGAEALPMLSDWTLLIKSNGIYFSNAYFIYRSSIFWSKLLTWHLSCVLSGWCEISDAYDYSSLLYDHSKSVRFEKRDIKTLATGTVLVVISLCATDCYGNSNYFYFMG